MDLDYFFNVIQMQYKTKLYPCESLIVLDEIQLFPQARQALKTLLEDKRYDYIETGSLAGITKKSKKAEILIPSEEYCVEMYPLDFEEFLWANGHKIVFYVEYNEQGKLAMEIDFLIRKDRKIIPIEAKSGKKYMVKSLEKFKKKFSNKIGLQYVLHEGDIKREGEIIYFPYYIASIL